MRRILLLLTMVAVMVAMMVATSGMSASAQDPCPSTGPSGGTATLVTLEEPRWAGFVCLDEEDQRFFCPDGFELWLLRDAGSSPPFQAECVEQSSPNDGGGTGGSDGGGDAEVTQNAEQQSESGEYNITTNIS
jgi:hypothetical protein